MWLRRPVAFVCVMGCLVSMAASGRLSVRLVTDGAVSFAFTPVFQIAAWAVVSRIGARARVPWRRAVDLFLAGDAPWLAWMVAVMALAAVVPPRHVGPWFLPVQIGCALPLGWAARLDLRFFRDVMQRSARGAWLDLAIHRALAWTAIVIYFFGIAIWGDIVPRVVAWIGL